MRIDLTYMSGEESMLNKATLIGNVGSDPEFRTMSNGNNVVNFRIATASYWKDKTTGELKSQSEWHSIVVYSQNLIEKIRSTVTKGSKLYLEGAIKTRKWQDKNGYDRYSTEIILQGYDAKLMVMIKPVTDQSGNPSNNYPSSNAQSSSAAPEYAADDIDDDIPF